MSGILDSLAADAAERNNQRRAWDAIGARKEQRQPQFQAVWDEFLLCLPCVAADPLAPADKGVAARQALAEQLRQWGWAQLYLPPCRDNLATVYRQMVEAGGSGALLHQKAQQLAVAEVLLAAASDNSDTAAHYKQLDALREGGFGLRSAADDVRDFLRDRDLKAREASKPKPARPEPPAAKTDTVPNPPKCNTWQDVVAYLESKIDKGLAPHEAKNGQSGVGDRPSIGFRGPR